MFMPTYREFGGSRWPRFVSELQLSFFLDLVVNFE